MSGWSDTILKSGGSEGGSTGSGNGQQNYADQTATGLGNIVGSLSAYDQYKNNARYMKDNKKNTLREAETSAATARRQYAGIASSQKAGLGASGVDVNQGSAVEAVAATDAEGEVAAKQLLHAGEMEALNWRLREKSAKQKSKMALWNAYFSAADIWQKGGQQKFWDGFNGSGGGKTLGDM